MSSFAAATDVFTSEELDAMVETKSRLTANNIKVSDRELAIVVMNCKLRVEKAVTKYTKWLEAMKDFGINSFDDVWGDLPKDGSGTSEQWKEVLCMISAYAACGSDKEGRSIMWIRSRPVQVAEEALAIRTGCLYYLAAHSDMTSLRNGITFVVDTASNDMVSGRIGNENKLQRTWQSMPLRPQKLFILGAGFLKRAVINALLALVSLFTSEKVLDRVRFVELDKVKECVDQASLPVYQGGQGGGMQSDEELLRWVRARLGEFPPLPSL